MSSALPRLPRLFHKSRADAIQPMVTVRRLALPGPLHVRRAVQALSLASLLASVAVFCITTRHWPLAGDAALMHYVAFLANHGRVPYRDILDINLPGAYLPDWLAQTFFGPSAIVWRLYDFSLLAVLGAAMLSLAGEGHRFAALWAACLLALIHGRDGVEQAGQRDLAAAALLVLALALLLKGARREPGIAAFVAGVCLAAAVLTKPTLAGALLLPLCLAGRSDEAPTHTAAPRLWLAAAGMCLPMLVVAAWLQREHAWTSFGYTLHVLAPFHASLGHVPWRKLVYDSLTPAWPLLAAALPVAWFTRRSDRETSAVSPLAAVRGRLLWWGAGAALLSYLLQRKGYLYHRYPLLAISLLLTSLLLERALQRPDALRSLGALALLWGGCVLGPVSAWKTAHYGNPEDEVVAELRLDLVHAAATAHLPQLSGEVQCLDTVDGCVDTLEHLQLLPSTGVLYDEFLFNDGDLRAVQDTRRRFFAAVQAHPPAIIVVTAPLFPSGPNDFRKLAQWPAFAAWLGSHYELFATRTPEHLVRSVGHGVTPAGYRLYLLRRAAPR